MKRPSFREHRWQILGVVMIGTFMAALDSSIVNVSIPVIMRSLNASIAEVGWVITSYLISFAIFMPLTAWTKDRIGHRFLYMLALGLFTVGSLLCGLAPTLPTLVLARIVQAIGGGALTPTAMALIAEVFEADERGQALGYWGLGVIVGPALGPTLGGILTEALGWRSIFLVNVPVGLVGLWLSIKILPKGGAAKPDHRKPFDLLGFISLGGFLGLFLYAVTQLENRDVPVDRLYAYFAVSAVLLGLYLATALRGRHPLLDLRLFRNRVFSACAAITMMRSAVLVGGVFLLPLLLQDAFHYSETRAGLLMLPGSVVLGALMPLAGRWADRHGVRTISWLGLILVAISMFLLGNVNVGHTMRDVSIALIIRGVGLGLLVTPISAATVNSVAHSQVALASSLSSLVQQVGGALGVAAAAAFYQWDFMTKRSMPGVEEAAAQLFSLEETFVVAGGITLLTLLPSFFLPKRPKARPPGSGHATEALVLE